MSDRTLGRFEVTKGLAFDKTTELTWRREVVGPVPWQDGPAACAALGAGFRLPTIRELMSLADYDGSAPTIESEIFAADVLSVASIWTSSPAPGNAGAAWVVDFFTGVPAPFDTNGNTLGVRCVR